MRLIAAIALVLTLPGCAGTASREEVPPNRIIAQNLSIGEDGLRFGFAPGEPFAHVLTSFTPDSGGLMICPLPSMDSALPPSTSCRTDVRSGVRETVTSQGLRAVALVATRERLDADVTVEFTGTSRSISALIPFIAAPVGPCPDVDCSPLIEVTPGHDGPLKARASWTGPSATLVLLQGRILARSVTANPGLPYREEARTEGPSPRSLDAQLSRTGEYALILRQAAGAGPLTDVHIDATWP